VSFRKPVIRWRTRAWSACRFAVDIAPSESSRSFELPAATSSAVSCFSDLPGVAFAMSASVRPDFVSCRSVATSVPRYCAVARTNAARVVPFRTA
jgi:hypothetical protein